MVEVFMRLKHSKHWLLLTPWQQLGSRGASQTRVVIWRRTTARVRKYSLLHLTRQAGQTTVKGQLLVVSLGRRGYLYPAWQFQAGQVLPGLERVLASLKDYDLGPS